MRIDPTPEESLSFNSDCLTENGELGVVAKLLGSDILLDDFIAFVDNSMMPTAEPSKAKKKEVGNGNMQER